MKSPLYILNMDELIEINADILRNIRVVCLSDTHGLHRQTIVPEGDLLVYAGDFTVLSRSLREIEDFADWIRSLPHPNKVLIPGNHEYFLEADPSRWKLLRGVQVLVNQATTIDGFRIFGSPTTPLYSGAFGRSSAADRKRIYDTIPIPLDILVTHGPPYGILDAGKNTGTLLGCQVLREAVELVKPTVHVFGHCHDSYGVVRQNGTLFVNAAVYRGHVHKVRPAIAIVAKPVVAALPK